MKNNHMPTLMLLIVTLFYLPCAQGNHFKAYRTENICLRDTASCGKDGYQYYLRDIKFNNTNGATKYNCQRFDKQYFEELKDENCPVCLGPSQEECKQYSQYFFDMHISQCPKCFNQECEFKAYDKSVAASDASGQKCQDQTKEIDRLRQKMQQKFDDYKEEVEKQQSQQQKAAQLYEEQIKADKEVYKNQINLLQKQRSQCDQKYQDLTNKLIKTKADYYQCTDQCPEGQNAKVATAQDKCLKQNMDLGIAQGKSKTCQEDKRVLNTQLLVELKINERCWNRLTQNCGFSQPSSCAAPQTLAAQDSNADTSLDQKQFGWKECAFVLAILFVLSSLVAGYSIYKYLNLVNINRKIQKVYKDHQMRDMQDMDHQMRPIHNLNILPPSPINDSPNKSERPSMLSANTVNPEFHNRQSIDYHRENINFYAAEPQDEKKNANPQDEKTYQKKQ